MIVISLLLILAAVAMLVLGLVSGASELLVGSIAASLLAAIALVIGARQSAASRAATGYLDGVDSEPEAGAADATRVRPRERVAAGASGRPYDRAAGAEATTESFPAVDGTPEPEPAAPPPMGSPASLAPPPLMDVPVQPAAGTDGQDDEIDDEEDPPDEPVPQLVSAEDAARVARMSAQVMVVDGRPRYHLPGCEHLLGRDSEPLPVAEAVDLGFTPCSLCEPDTSLLAEAR